MLTKDQALDTVEMRQAYCEALIQAANNGRVICIDCDLGSSMGTKPFRQAFPDRSFNLGIQEANACGVASGLSTLGFVPFVHSFAAFTSRRIYDQIFLSCAYAKQNVKLIGGDAGVSAATNGGTHMAFEDVGLLRNVPGTTVLDASDTTMVRSLVSWMAGHFGVDYLRMPRKRVHRIYEQGTNFVVGKANVLLDGCDVTIISSGLLVYEALQAARQLAQEGISARVVDMFTIKPVDVECIVESAKKTGAIVTAENHNIVNGLGSAVADVLGKYAPTPLEQVGVQDVFGEVGTQDYLMERFGLTSGHIVSKVRRVISRK